MSKRNAHHNSRWVNDVAVKCRKRGCSGTLIRCIVKYSPRGPLEHEMECETCSFVRRDPRWKKRKNNNQWKK